MNPKFARTCNAILLWTGSSDVSYLSFFVCPANVVGLARILAPVSACTPMSNTDSLVSNLTYYHHGHLLMEQKLFSGINLESIPSYLLSSTRPIAEN